MAVNVFSRPRSQQLKTSPRRCIASKKARALQQWLSRHHDLSARMAQKLSKARNAVTREGVTGYFFDLVKAALVLTCTAGDQGPPTNALRGKRLAELYFTKTTPTGNEWKCKCGHVHLKKTTGYTNLCSHVMSCHPEYVHLNETDADHPSIIANMLIPHAVRKVFGWL
ncbi:hypothetical protein H257_01398 [Aphanomyces astaci]|uniref:Uncharacterized protein n=1 Tax=Aphanomyces astaci TaxID=112090 RepID=W4HA79_APHAT|nr:hypothetical protein H257_01398 [Aphanomyces astaci]ETV88013.1 hypothetical protein H257_01398 [Aphanomyces astaci]|eukprot:XP_009822876.1 hypothetical protein H257_01398 [Aphanomyces astaci]